MTTSLSAIPHFFSNPSRRGLQCKPNSDLLSADVLGKLCFQSRCSSQIELPTAPQDVPSLQPHSGRLSSRTPCSGSPSLTPFQTSVFIFQSSVPVTRILLSRCILPVPCSSVLCDVGSITVPQVKPQHLRSIQKSPSKDHKESFCLLNNAFFFFLGWPHTDLRMQRSWYSDPCGQEARGGSDG